MKKLIAIRLDEKHLQILEHLKRTSGWSQSDLFRKMIENAYIQPAAMGTNVPKSAAPAVNP